MKTQVTQSIRDKIADSKRQLLQAATRPPEPTDDPVLYFEDTV